MLSSARTVSNELEIINRLATSKLVGVIQAAKHLAALQRRLIL